VGRYFGALWRGVPRTVTDTEASFEKKADAKTTTQRCVGVGRTKLEDNHVRPVTEYFFGKVFLGARHREAAYGHNLKVNFELASLPQMLDGQVQKSGFWRQWKSVDHASPKSFDTQIHS
jgi:hypothetical protein